jgi:hypothetical protein
MRNISIRIKYIISDLDTLLLFLLDMVIDELNKFLTLCVARRQTCSKGVGFSTEERRGGGGSCPYSLTVVP